MLELNSGGRRRTLAMAFAAAAFATAFTVQGASPAHAASPYDGADPAATGCASNAKTLASAPLYLPGTTSQVGTIEMRYSNTCLTQWIRVQSDRTRCSGDPCRNKAEITRPAGADGPALTVGRGNVAAGEPYQWSLMVYTPNTRSCGTGSADTGNNTGYPYGEWGRQICG
ncbi:DUF2690 domain-containing protein [Streptomyces sp. MA5143a]|uniref:DUF2690 domain-containing protein n=1 Tax=Streptomyces sp. MA5143a TaxID=2083010 RepID=UPI0015E6C634|nr:DUF2690 domain-containing protein [Streptomyces sp. MA5143a]